ncbi:MAG: IS66 family transposase, partial [Rhodobacteraceae bacterium]|nr:IS66 family transposase [Paracoccaceae bacterium]
MDRNTLEKLSKPELVELILSLQRPSKTSRTSSKPPSTDKKAQRAQSKPGGAKPGRQGHSRSLHATPDEIVDHRPDRCSECATELPPDLQAEIIGEYDEIELPPIAPLVFRHRRLRVCCPHYRARVKGDLPDAATGTPFGPRLHALALYLKTYQSVSFARLPVARQSIRSIDERGYVPSRGLLANHCRAVDEVFGVKVSQGTLANMLKRSHRSFEAARQEIINELRQADVVASDETGVR